MNSPARKRSHQLIPQIVIQPCELTFLVLQQQQNLGRRLGTSKMHLSPWWLRLPVVLLLLTFCLLLLPLWASVIVLCFVVRYFMSILVLQSSWWGRERELVALLNLSSWCLVMVEWFFLAVPWDCLRFVIVVFPDHTLLLFFVTNATTLENYMYTVHKIKSWLESVSQTLINTNHV